MYIVDAFSEPVDDNNNKKKKLVTYCIPFIYMLSVFKAKAEARQS